MTTTTEPTVTLTLTVEEALLASKAARYLANTVKSAEKEIAYRTLADKLANAR